MILQSLLHGHYIGVKQTRLLNCYQGNYYYIIDDTSELKFEYDATIKKIIYYQRLIGHSSFGRQSISEPGFWTG